MGRTVTSKQPALAAGESRRELVDAISADLRHLVLVLNALFELENQDGEALFNLLNAKSAAERGLVLSERLAELSSSETARRQTTH